MDQALGFIFDRRTSMIPTSSEFPSHLFDMIDSFKKSAVLFAACELGIFDELKDHEPCSAISLSSSFNSHPEATQKFLDACAALELLYKQEQDGQFVYYNSKLAEKYLTKGSSLSLLDLIKYNILNYDSYRNLAKIVMTGKSSCSERIYLDNSESCDHRFPSDPKQKLELMRALNETARLSAEKIVTAFDLSGFKTTCDVGGGSGCFSFALSAFYPQMKVIMMEHLDVIELAQQHFPSPSMTGDYNVTFHPGDIIQDPLPPADLYFLSRIIYQLDVSKIDILLKKVYKSLKPGGAIVIVDSLLDEDKLGPSSVVLLDLNILMTTGGRKRPASEYREILTSQGFLDVEIKYRNTCLDVIMAYK